MILQLPPVTDAQSAVKAAVAVIVLGDFDISFEIPNFRVMLIIACGVIVVAVCITFLVIINRK